MAALSGHAPTEAARFITDFTTRPDILSYRGDFARGLALRLACEDMKAFYLEAVSAQPGQRAVQQAQEWFWRDTVAGRVFIKLRDACLASHDPSVQRFGANHLIPRAMLHTLTTLA